MHRRNAAEPAQPDQAHLCGLSPIPIFNTNPPPYFDDGTAGALQTFATNTAALASRVRAATAQAARRVQLSRRGSGAVPASTSVAHEGAGTEVSVLAPGNIMHTYPGAITMNTSQSVSDLGSYTNVPNQQHASSLSPAVNPTFTSFTAGSSVSGVGTTTLSCVTVDVDHRLCLGGHPR